MNRHCYHERYDMYDEIEIRETGKIEYGDFFKCKDCDKIWME
jgi:hypothetical protein